jgi:hypothetical protein
MAADVKISALQNLAALADPDLFVVVDVSDQGMAITGTDKKLTAANLAAYLTPVIASALQISGVNTGDVTITPGTGLGLVGQLLSLTAASGSVPGAITTGNQILAGIKTFNNGLAVAGGIISVAAASRVINVPSIQLPGGAGGWGYGGGLQLGSSEFNSLNIDSSLYLQSYGVPVELRGASQEAWVTGYFGANLGASDIAVRLGTRTADANVNASAKLVSFGTGIGSSFVEAMYVQKRSSLSSVLTIDTNSETNVGGLLIKGNGQGYSGIWFNSLSEVQMGVGSSNTLGFAIQSTNRAISFYVNSDAFSAAADAAFQFQTSESVAMRVKDTVRVTSDAAHTGNLAAWYLGATSRASIRADGRLIANGFHVYGGTDPVVRIGTGNDSSSSIAFYSTAADNTFTSFTSRTFLYSRNSRFCIESSTGVLQIGGNQGLGPSATALLMAGAGEIRSDLGAGSTDVGLKVGSTLADASVHTTAKLFSVGTGVGGTYNEYVSVMKGVVTLHGDRAWIFATDPNGASNHWEWRFRSGLDMTWGNNSSVYFGCDINDGYMYTQFGFKHVAGATTYFKTVLGRVDQWGTDSTGTPGNVNAGTPTGKSSIAVGQSTVRVTTTACSAASRVLITPHARDATCKELIAVPGAGFFDVSGTANATAALPFSWQVSTIL